MSDAPPLLEFRRVTKRYGGVSALTEVDFQARPGEIHAVLGENGAGKSTLIKIASGVADPTEGEILFEGRPVRFSTPVEAREAGVVCVFQELSLIPDLTVADNLCLADPPRRFGFVDQRRQRQIARALLDRVGCQDVHPMELVRNLPLSRRQMVEIAKALATKPKLLILDEATSALTAADVERVHAIVRELKQDGVGVLYVSHHMHEIEALADVATVFRNGRQIETFPVGSRSMDDIITMMIGRDYSHAFPEKPPRDASAPAALSVRDLGWGEDLSDISFTVKRGEIVGLGGLDGQGQRELLLALFGVLIGVRGSVSVGEERLRLSSPRRAMRASKSMALIPEDRKTEGLMLPMSVRDNMSLAALGRFETPFGVDAGREKAAVEEMAKRLQLLAPDMNAAVSTLSGGNQQKVVLAKWLMTEPAVVLLNDPTRGIDVGTKQEIYRLLRALADQGAAILFYSTDYAELIGCCDRVLVLYGGRVARELEGEALNERELIASALNVATDETGSAAA